MATLREWRRPPREAWWALAGYVIFFFLVGLITVDNMSAAPSVAEELVPVTAMLVYSVVAGILSYRIFAHARVLATSGGLIISNPFRSDQSVAWSEISWMKADRLLTIGLNDERTIIAWVIQKNGWSRARHERTSADEAIDELSALASAQLGAAREFART